MFYLALLVSRSLLLVHTCVAYSHLALPLHAVPHVCVAYILTFASSSAHTVPHAVSGPDCAALLPAVVALAVALLTVLLLLVAAVVTAILFYTSESLH